MGLTTTGATPRGPILSAFDRHCRDRPDALALWSRGESLRLSFRQFGKRVAGWQQRLDAAHLPSGSPVAVALGNRVDFPALFLALVRTGHPMASVDASLPSAERLELCRRLGIGLLVERSTDEHRTVAATEGARFGDIHFTPSGAVDSAEDSAGITNTALIKLTSGSTGEPAGICLSEDALAAGIRQIGEGMEITSADRLLLAIPLSHSYGFDHGVLACCVLGAALVLETRYFPASLLRALRTSEATFFPAVPPMVKALAESDWPTGLALRRVISAGGPLLPEFASNFHQASGQHVHQFYGSTETGGISFETDPADPAARSTVGHPLPGVTIDLDDASTVRVDSPANFHAYLGAPARNDRRVTLADRGEWTAEGRLRLTGRTADLLNVGGRRVSAGSIETTLRKFDGIEDAAVIGIADPVRGDRVVAFVVAPGGPLDWSAHNLPIGLTQRDVRPLDALPYTQRGKLDRARLRRMALDG